MTPTEYRALTEQLIANASGDGRILGLVALGSMAEQGTAPDVWSDHDFFLVVEDGSQEHFRSKLEWLPHHDRIAHWFRETEHGLKVLFDDGHLVEFAVFARPELRLRDLCKRPRE